MLCRRSLYGTALLSCLLAFPVLGAELRFVTPEPDALLAGTMELSFAAEAGPDEPPIERVDVYFQGTLIGSALPPEWKLLWDAPPEALGGTLGAVAYAGGQVVAKTRLESRQISFGEEISVVMVQLYPVVVDRRGKYIGGLAKEDFELLDQGNPVEIESFSTEAATLSIVLVLDVSASMIDRLGLVQDASAAFLDRLQEYDQVGLYAFNFALQPVVPLTQDHAQVKEGIRSLRASGSTALYDALLGVLDRISTVQGRRAVFLFSDGLDERSLSTLDQVIAGARRSEAIIYTVGAGKDADARAARKDLRALAEETGGEAHFIERVRELPRVFDAVLLHLRSQYAIGYTPPAGPSGIRSVEVRARSSSYTVRCRRTYYHQDRR